MNSAGQAMPRIIYSLWLQGERAAPEVVRLVFRRWAALNPDYELRVLDGEDAAKLLSGFPLALQDMTRQALSDVVRARLLIGGGVWADATVLPIIPLDEWLPELMKDSGFFAFERPAPDRPLSSWFMASTADHLLTTRWWHEVNRFWSIPRRLATYDTGAIPCNPAWEVAPDGGALKAQYPYFWFHYLFAHLLENDGDFAACWAGCRKIPAEPPASHLERLFSGRNLPSREEIMQAARGAPVHKLNWRRKYPRAALAALTAGTAAGSSPLGAYSAGPTSSPFASLTPEPRGDPPNLEAAIKACMDDAANVQPLALYRYENYNIVGIGDLYVALAQELGSLDILALLAEHGSGPPPEKLMIALEPAALEAAIGAYLKTAAKPAPRLLCAYRGYNIVEVGTRFVGVAQELGPLDVAAVLAGDASYPPESKFLVAADRLRLQHAIDALVHESAKPLPQLLHAYKSYNIVSVGEVYVAAAQELGPLDVKAVLAGAAPRPSTAKFLTADDPASLHAAIDLHLSQTG